MSRCMLRVAMMLTATLVASSIAPANDARAAELKVVASEASATDATTLSSPRRLSAQRGTSLLSTTALPPISEKTFSTVKPRTWSS
jgi:hypothetical protein